MRYRTLSARTCQPNAGLKLICSQQKWIPILPDQWWSVSSMSGPPDVVGFLYRDYCYKWIVKQIPHYDSLVPIPYTDWKFFKTVFLEIVITFYFLGLYNQLYCFEYVIAQGGGVVITVVAEGATNRVAALLSTSESARRYYKLYHLLPTKEIEIMLKIVSLENDFCALYDCYIPYF